MGYKITAENDRPTMSHDPDTTIATDLLLSAMVQRGSFFFNPDFGMRSAPGKNTAHNLGLINDYAKEAVQWLIDGGRAKSIKVLVEPDITENDRVNIQHEAQQKNDETVTFETFVGVV